MAEICPLCDGTGMRVVEREGRTFAEPCECRLRQRTQRRLRLANIPRRYEHCSFESFDKDLPSSDKSLKQAYFMAKKFVEGFPLETDGKGLHFTGPAGVGKTHLAVAILKSVIAERGATGLFYDYRDLLKQIQNSYNRQVAETELEILAPVFEAEVLVIDELGAIRPSDWVWDTVAHILNTRYNDCRTTIITTNFENLPPLSREQGQMMNDAQRAARGTTLGDRIGETMRSRLQEMCVTVDMRGEDFRQSIKQARFG